ncbi:MAG: hypothetical protein CALGDGBN_02132 [Pseudomonadales bacterium]|nr:hypothetical protein [Pseudomonadales bacterium]
MLGYRVTRTIGRVLAIGWLSVAGLPALASSLSDPVLQNAEALEVEVSRRAVCAQRIDAYQARLDTLNSDPQADAAVISDLETRIESNRRCVSTATTRIERLNAVVLGAANELVAATGLGQAEVDTRVAALRELEARRVALRLDIRQYERQLAELAQDPVGNAVRIERRTAMLDAALAELRRVKTQIADQGAALRDLEASALAALAEARSATLSWIMPTTRADGAPLAAADIGGYEIYMIAESTGETQVIVIEDPLAVTHRIADLQPGTYHFSIAAYDVVGQFSEMSEVVSKTIL